MSSVLPDDDWATPRLPREGDRRHALAARLAEAGIESARIDARLLLEAVTGRERADLIARPRLTLTFEQEERLEQLVRRRLAREPMAYILGEKEFWSLPFVVGPAVLVPRPETETVVEAALELVHGHAPLRILDLGTGSGCLLLALLSELPKAGGLGTDISEPALAMAQENAKRLGLAGRAEFRRAEWGRGIEGRFDLVVANPPYVAEPDWPALPGEVRDHEPRGALCAGTDGLDAYRAIAPQLARLLAPDGSACLELGQGQAGAVEAIMRAQGLDIAGGRRDLAGIVRCLVVRRPI